MTDYQWFISNMELYDNNGTAFKVQRCRKGKFLYISLSLKQLKKYVKKQGENMFVNIQHVTKRLYKNKGGMYMKYRGLDVYVVARSRQRPNESD